MLARRSIQARDGRRVRHPRRAVAALLAVGLAAGSAGSAAAETPGPDTTAWRFEAGVGTDFTNEQFYEDAFVDSISLGRRLVSTPEARTAGILSATWNGTRALRATRYALRSEVSLGDKVQRGAVNLTWRSPLGEGWRLYAAPRAELRRDRTFDRDLEELRGALSIRAKRDVATGLVPEVGLDGDVLRTRGTGADFLPDRDGARVSAAIGSGGWAGTDWRLGYGLAARAFPDSADRDHFEHEVDGRWRRDLGPVTLALDAAAQRRVTRRPATTSRDNFWDGQVGMDLDLRAGLAWTWRLRLAAEAVRYDVEDSTLYFDYQVLRGRLGPRRDLGPWSLSAGPRAEALLSRVDPTEEYVELGAFADLEYLGSGFWTFTPALGRRAYRAEGSTDPFGVIALHSDYTFYELSLMADQPLPGDLRIRALGTGRYERHAQVADDARSLYFSLDVRRLF